VERRGFVTAAVVLALIGLMIAAPGASASTITVNCAKQSLQTKINKAAPGSTLLISGTCTGNFAVGKNLTLKGNPSATLDGGGAGTTLTITGTHTTHLRSLVVTGGTAARGGGIEMASGGLLTLDEVKLRNNLATGPTTGGGGIDAKNAIITIRHSSIVGNHATAIGSGLQVAQAGALYANGGTVTISNSVLSGNRATSNSSASLAETDGGGIVCFEGSLSISSSVFKGNRASAAAASSPSAQAGAVLFQAAGTEQLTIQGSTFDSNAVVSTENGSSSAVAFAGAVKASSGSGAAMLTGSSFTGNTVTVTSSSGSATAGGGGIYGSGPLTMASTTIADSSVSATGATTATAAGGGIQVSVSGPTVLRSTISGNVVTVHSGTNTALATGGGIDARGSQTVSVLSSSVAGNKAHAVSDASAAGAGGGGIYTSSGEALVLKSSTVSGNTASGSATAANAEALGGGIELLSSAATDRIANSTIANNHASVTGPTSDAYGGAIEIDDAGLVLHLVTIARNGVSAPGPSAFAAGAGGLDIETGTTTLEGTILASNTVVIASSSSTHGPNCLGTSTSDGYNVLGSIAGCTFTPASTDQTGKVPKLGSLANNGGPTKTMALQTGSPALNRIPSTPCHAMAKKDQRGVKRPQGLKCDVGAYERAA
jgi:hypothetical protein